MRRPEGSEGGRIHREHRAGGNAGNGLRTMQWMGKRYAGRGSRGGSSKKRRWFLQTLGVKKVCVRSKGVFTERKKMMGKGWIIRCCPYVDRKVLGNSVLEQKRGEKGRKAAVVGGSPGLHGRHQKKQSI